MTVIVDLGTSNVGSIVNMLRRLGHASTVTRDAEVVRVANRIIMPGVGSFDAGVASLRNSGLEESLTRAVLERAVPCLGICLGMQLMCDSSEEGELPGLSWFDATVVRFPRTLEDGSKLRVPHMGWNRVTVHRAHPIFAAMADTARFYFVHGYHVRARSPELVLGVTHHGVEFTSSAGRDNVVAVQFHPEKSHKYGLALMSNFMQWSP